jgi:hypothetical protein
MAKIISISMAYQSISIIMKASYQYQNNGNINGKAAAVIAKAGVMAKYIIWLASYGLLHGWRISANVSNQPAQPGWHVAQCGGVMSMALCMASASANLYLLLISSASLSIYNAMSQCQCVSNAISASSSHVSIQYSRISY